MPATGSPRDDAADATSPTDLAAAAPSMDAEPLASDDAAPAPVADDVITATLRRSPKYTMFLLAGAALGVLIALILTTAFHGTQLPSESGYTYSAGQVFGFLTLLCVPVGLAVGGIVALVIDRSSARRARELTVGRERFRDDG